MKKMVKVSRESLLPKIVKERAPECVVQRNGQNGASALPAVALALP